MPGDRFLDTNILIYAFAAGDPRSTPAEGLLAEGGVISVQVLNEFTHVARRKSAWPWDRIDSALAIVLELVDAVRPLTVGIHERAMRVARESQLSFYDALIVASAADAGCQALLTEDLQHGCAIDGVTIKNPFLGAR